MRYTTLHKPHLHFIAACASIGLSMITTQAAPCPVPATPPSHAGGISKIIHNIGSNPTGSDLAAARTAAAGQAASNGISLGYHSTARCDFQRFEGKYTPPALPADKVGKFVYGLAIFSDDGSSVKVNGQQIFSRYSQLQGLPDTANSFSVLPIVLEPGVEADFVVDYSNMRYTGNQDIDGCILFLYLEPVKTCFVKKTWSDPLLSLPTDWVEPFRAEIKKRISETITVDLDVARGMLTGIRLSIQMELQKTDLPEAVVDELNKMLIEVNILINNASQDIEKTATKLAQNAAGFVADSMLNAWLGLDFVADKAGPVPAVTAEYRWQQGAFDSGSWTLLTGDTVITGLNNVSISGTGKAELSTALGIALGVAATVEAPAKVEINGSVGGTLSGRQVASIVMHENVISFEPRYDLTVAISASVKAGWGIELGGGLAFDYTLPLATPNSTDTAFSLGQQSLTADENDKNKICK